MLTANLISTLFYSTSYPYIYAETVKVVPHYYISIEQILACVGSIIFCEIWNKNSDRLFKYYDKILWLEIIADTYLFTDVLIRDNLSFYFLLNIIIFSIITKNLICGGNKMRAKINPTEKLREIYDNNATIMDSIGTLVGAGFAMICNLDIKILFILAYIGNIIDNIFYLHIYGKIRKYKL
jgi:hypothetical protein